MRILQLGQRVQVGLYECMSMRPLQTRKNEEQDGFVSRDLQGQWNATAKLRKDVVKIVKFQESRAPGLLLPGHFDVEP